MGGFNRPPLIFVRWFVSKHRQSQPNCRRQHNRVKQAADRSWTSFAGICVRWWLRNACQTGILPANLISIAIQLPLVALSLSCSPRALVLLCRSTVMIGTVIRFATDLGNFQIRPDYISRSQGNDRNLPTQEKGYSVI